MSLKHLKNGSQLPHKRTGKFSLAIFYFSLFFILCGKQTIPLENISVIHFFAFLFRFQSHLQILNISIARIVWFKKLDLFFISLKITFFRRLTENKMRKQNTNAIRQLES